MSLDRNVSDAMDREVGGKIDRMEENRQEQWAERREDRDWVRDSIEKQTENWDDPKPKRKMDDDSSYDVLNPFGDIRKAAEEAYESTWLDAEKQERRNRDFEQFDLISKRIKRAHGIDGIEGIKRLLNVEEMSRYDPETVARHILQSAANGHAQEVAQTEYDNTKNEVVDVFKRYEINEEIEPLMIEFMRTPEFQNSKTGDNEADIKRAYRMVTEGLKRARLPGGRR